MKLEEIAAQYDDRIEELLRKLENVGKIVAKEDRATVDGCFLGTVTVIESLYGSTSPQAKALLEARKACTVPVRTSANPAHRRNPKSGRRTKRESMADRQVLTAQITTALPFPRC